MRKREKETAAASPLERSPAPPPEVTEQEASKKRFWMAVVDGNAQTMAGFLSENPSWALIRLAIKEGARSQSLLAVAGNRFVCVSLLLAASDQCGKEFAQKDLLSALGVAFKRENLELVEDLSRRLRPAAASGVSTILFDHFGSVRTVPPESRKCALAMIPKCDARAVSKTGETLLISAVEANFEEGVRALLPRSDANGRSHYKQTALMAAARMGHGECVKALLDATDLNAVDQDGETALDLAIKWRQWSAIDLVASSMSEDDARRALAFEEEGGYRSGGLDRLPICRALIERSELAKSLDAIGEARPAENGSLPSAAKEAGQPSSPSSRRL